jgi:hypothetical protein
MVLLCNAASSISDESYTMFSRTNVERAEIVHLHQRSVRNLFEQKEK